MPSDKGKCKSKHMVLLLTINRLVYRMSGFMNEEHRERVKALIEGKSLTSRVRSIV
jgi:hypothetical protein